MKVTFFSNFLNHHQTPFCDEMYKQLDGNFVFVSTIKTPLEFLDGGYPDCSNFVYNLKSYIDENFDKKAFELGLASDVVIIGSAPDIYIKERLKHNKLTFRYSERFFKQGYWRLFDPRVLFSLIHKHTIYRNKNVYMLCASGYLANDLKLIFAYPHKVYKWGYFTLVDQFNIDKIICQKPVSEIEILWTSRFIAWKHPEMAVRLAYYLKRKGYNFHLNMVGNGVLLDKIKYLAEKLNVKDKIDFLGSLPNDEVRKHMLRANIFIFTSDRNEGWGAVLNEAMSSACAVVASDSIGSVPFLIANNRTGLIYRSGDIKGLENRTEELIKNKLLREKISRSAYSLVSEIWNPENAARNFLQLADNLNNGYKHEIVEGPCSIATTI